MIFIVDEVKNFAANNIFFKLLELVTYWDSCKGVSHVLGFVHHWWRSYTWEVGSSDVSSSTKIVEYRDKNFVLDLKLFFIIVNYFSRRFPPMLFTMKLVCFVGFPRSSYLFLFTFPLCMILTWYWCLFVLTRFIHNKSN